MSLNAAVTKLDQLSTELGKLISCVIILLGDEWTLSTLGEEWRTSVIHLSDEISRYLDALCGDAYMEHTGMVWNTLDRMKPVSTCEVEAVKKRWKTDAEIISDAWKEFKDYITGDEPDEDERKFALAAKPLLALYQLLHAAVPRSIQPKARDSYQDLLQASAELQAAFDAAVLAVYDQDSEQLEETFAQLERLSDSLLLDEAFALKWRERCKIESHNWEMSRG